MSSDCYGKRSALVLLAAARRSDRTPRLGSLYRLYHFNVTFLILPRSRHLPVAATDGSLTKNLSKTWVRLWT